MAWLGYDGCQALTAAQLHACGAWPHLNALLSKRLLTPTALLAVAVAYVSTAEVWAHAAVDWTLQGLGEALERHGYAVAAASVLKFQANNSRFAPLAAFRGGRNAEVLVLRLGHGEALRLQPCELVEGHETWDAARPKRVSPEARRLLRLKPLMALARG